MLRILVIDNYDSFTFNLVHLVAGRLPGARIEVLRNDQRSLEELGALAPSWLIVSPGPCTPRESGVSMAAIGHFLGRIPILGVCLGMQCISAHFGARVVRAREPVHGKVRPIHHQGGGLFADLPTPIPVMRYHSLIVERESLPMGLEVSAWDDWGQAMALRHRELPVEGVQFHPESFLTPHGASMIEGFIRRHLADAVRPSRASILGATLPSERPRGRKSAARQR